jgi:hypothetical protein
MPPVMRRARRQMSAARAHAAAARYRTRLHERPALFGRHQASLPRSDRGSDDRGILRPAALADFRTCRSALIFDVVSDCFAQLGRDRAVVQTRRAHKLIAKPARELRTDERLLLAIVTNCHHLELRPRPTAAPSRLIRGDLCRNYSSTIAMMSRLLPLTSSADQDWSFPTTTSRTPRVPGRDGLDVVAEV